MAQTSTSGYGNAVTRRIASLVSPGMSTGTTTTASMSDSVRASSPIRIEEPIPVPQDRFTTTAAPDRSAVARTCSAAAPRTTTTGSHPASRTVSST